MYLLLSHIRTDFPRRHPNSSWLILRIPCESNQRKLLWLLLSVPASGSHKRSFSAAPSSPRLINTSTHLEAEMRTYALQSQR